MSSHIVRGNAVGWVLALAFFVLSVPMLGVAQEDESIAEMPNPEVAAPAGTVSCFDYYSFGSIQAHLTSSVVGAVSGTSIVFKGTLENKNAYPVVDGALYVKIFRERDVDRDANGPDVVGQFLVKGDIVIPANGSVPVSFSWKIPAYALSGNYRAATFFTASRKFNLLGLSFTDDVVGNTVPFTVSGEQSTGVQFDKTGVTVGDQKYFFAAYPPRVPQKDPVIVTVQVRNTTATVQKISVRFQVYQWDAQLRENVVQEETRSVEVPAGKSGPVSITVSDARYPVYLVVGTLQWKDTKSIIGIRFVREGVDRTRINFPGVTSFPLKAGEQTTLFSCLHNSGEAASVSDGRLDLTLSDMAGNIIREYHYAGDVTGAMMGLADRFTPARSYDRFVLDARLYHGDEFIDEAHLVYDCNQIAPETCMKGDMMSAELFGHVNPLYALLYTILGVVVLCVLWLVVRALRPKTLEQL